MTGYTTGDNNQLESDGTYSYEYDAEGNRTKRTHDTTGESTEYEWDYRNRLTKVTEKDGQGATTQAVEYTYDVFNRRIGKAVDTSSPFDMADAVIERYVLDDMTGVASLDGGNVVLDFVDADGEGAGTMDLERRYLYGNAVDQVLAQENVDESTGSADRVYWHLVDHLGTVRDLAKNDGTLGEHYEYDSYGNVVSGDTSVTRYLFTSREFDEDTGLQHSRARWYDAAVGRWVSEDPIGFAAGDANTQRYVQNDPQNHIDSSGLTSKDDGATGGPNTINNLSGELPPGTWYVVAVDTTGGVGHAWIGMVDVDAETAIAIGFYPARDASTRELGAGVPGEFRDDANRQFTIARAYPIPQDLHDRNSAYMQTLIDRGDTFTYDLQDNNCATWVANIQGVTNTPQTPIRPADPIKIDGASNDPNEPDYLPTNVAAALKQDEEGLLIIADD